MQSERDRVDEDSRIARGPFLRNSNKFGYACEP